MEDQSLIDNIKITFVEESDSCIRVHQWLCQVGNDVETDGNY